MENYDAQICAPICAEIRAVCKDKKMPLQEKYDRLYMLQSPNDDIRTDVESMLLAPITSHSKQWSDYFRMWSDVLLGVSVECVIEKVRQVMEVYPFSLEAVINLRRVDRDGRLWEEKVYPGDVWRGFDLMPYNIKLPNVPNLMYGNVRSKFSEPRTEAFLRLLNEESEEFITKFILMTMAQTNGMAVGGVLEFKYRRDDEGYTIYGEEIAYSTPEQLKRFPKWYQAWDRLVPTMCQRYQFYGNLGWNQEDGGGIQAACGDLSGSNYRMSWEMAREMQEKERRGETFGSAVSY